MSSPNTAWLDDEFKAVRDDFLKNIKNPTKHDFTKVTTAQDVWDATDEIQKRQSQTKTLKGLNRIRPFLEALDQFSSTIEVFVQAKPDILALIWGPVKFLLQVSSALSSVFEKVVKVLADVGNSLPLFNEYALLFKNNRTIKHVLRLFYTEILEFYKILLNFMNDRRLKTCLEPFWPSIRSKISVVEDNIRRHKGLLTDHVMLEHIFQSDKSRQQALQEHARNEESRTEQGFAAALAEFKPPMYHGILADILQRSSVESGSWLITNEEYNEWARAKDPSRRCLWLQGIPGSGKTFLVANMIHGMQQQSSGIVIYLFLTHDDQSRGRILEVFTSILFQAAKNDEALKSTLLEEIRSNGSKLSSNVFIQKMTLDLLSSSGPTYVVVDGLDEIEDHSRKPLLQALLELSGSCSNIKLLVSSRPERDIVKALRDRAVSIKIDIHNQDDIRKFIEFEGKNWMDDLKDYEADKAMLASAQEGLAQVQRKSEGMFLYTKLVLQLLKVQGTATDIQAELESLPDGLDQAYDRILTRINTKLLPAQRALARKVLGWVSCALRPLRQEELLQILVVEPGETEFRKGRRFHADIQSACGPIIEIIDGVVRFVHFSAKEYITDKRTSFLDLEKAALDAAITCSSYLCHNSLDVLFEAGSSSINEVDQTILNKDFVFFDYAANMWLQHIVLIKKGAAGAESGLNDILSRLFMARDLNAAQTLDPPESMLERFNLFEDEGDLQKMLAYSYKVQGQIRYGQSVEELEEMASRSIVCRLLSALHIFRAHIEDLYCGNVSHLDLCQCPEPLRTYGAPVFFCEKPFCSKYNRGFPTRSARDQHKKSHQRAYTCPFTDCFYFEHGFQTKAALSSHQKATHQQGHTPPNHADTGAPSERSLDELDDDDLSLVLKDAIIHSNLDTIRSLLRLRPDLAIVLLNKFYASGEPSSYDTPNFDYCLCLAAWKSTTEVLSFLVDRNPHQFVRDRRLVYALATAIETKNRDNVKYLLSFNPILVQDIFLPRDFEKSILNTQRVQAPESNRYYIAEDIVSRSLGLWDPEFMDFLIEECQLSIPSDLKIHGRLFSCAGLFSQPAIQGLTLDEVRQRFEQMRKYVTDSNAFNDGVWHSIASFSPYALTICLENHGDPDHRFSGSLNRRNALGLAYKRKNRVSREMMRLLLKYGATPKLLSKYGNPRSDVMNSFEWSEGVAWNDFVKKAMSGEDLATIIPEKRRDKS